MKKILLFMGLAVATAASAQQITNGDFEGNWGECTPWTSGNNTQTMSSCTDIATGQKMTTALQPEGWNIANVIGVGGLGATQVGEQTDGYNSTKAVKLYNKANAIMATQIVPGYLTLGTPWNTSVMGSKNDGGAFGGVAFTGRPDALSFMYKRAHGEDSTEPFTVVAYTWIGSTTQAEVPANIVAFGNPKKTDMQNRDRNILGIATDFGGAVTKTGDFQLVASINDNTDHSDASTWTRKTLPFTYTAKRLVPEKLNVVFSAGDYFVQNNKAGDELSVDDVKLVYYSRLSSITFQGNPIEGFDPNTYEYTVTVPEGYDPADAAFDVEKEVMGYAATVNEHGGADYIIKVQNPDGADEDGLSEHTYTIHFVAPEVKAEPEGTKYEGLLYIEMMGEHLAEGDTAAVYISSYNPDYTVNFTLPDFSLASMGLELGDIAVPNMKVYRDEASKRYYYEGKVDRLTLAGGFIVAKVDVFGYIADDGAINLSIPVVWMPDESDEESWIPITVRFYTEGTSADEDLTRPATAYLVDSTTVGIHQTTEATPVKKSIYDLQGRQLTKLQKGLNIVGGHKVVVK